MGSSGIRAGLPALHGLGARRCLQAQTNTVAVVGNLGLHQVFPVPKPFLCPRRFPIRVALQGLFAGASSKPNPHCVSRRTKRSPDLRCPPRVTHERPHTPPPPTTHAAPSIRLPSISVGVGARPHPGGCLGGLLTPREAVNQSGAKGVLHHIPGKYRSLK